jgi:(1->4)-alpha-D-glucan 1-alpha-D-glucosylmutase
VAELLACFPVYRSYLPAGRDHLDEAFAAAREHRPDLADVLDDLVDVLADPSSPAAARFQQTSGMVMAKGVEDCSFYRTSRLTSLTEVGADPATFAVSPQDFHQAMVKRQLDWPRAMTALSTHDTKRSEDVRARIAVLAEAPDLWAETMDRLQELAPMPDAGFASLAWQAAAGAWPLDRERLHAYAEKAMREAGDHTTWTDPDAGHEQAVHGALDAAYDDPAVTAVVEHVVERIRDAGRSNALSAKLVAITAPGVPDVYQGTELWDLSLVDPDNRRPVDFDRRAELLGSATDATGDPDSDDEDSDDEGRAKLLVTHRALTARRDSAHLFTTYRPLAATGPAADHVLAFDRGGAITVATRLPLGLERVGGWGETTLELPPGRWRNVLDRSLGQLDRGGVRVAELLGSRSVALLVKED